MSILAPGLEKLRRKAQQVRFRMADSRFEVVRTEFADVVDVDHPVRRIAGGFRFTEGPVWLPSRRTLLFSDIPADTIYRWTPERGVDVFRRPSGNSNGLTLDAEGRLIACEHATRRVTRTATDGSVEVLANSYRGKLLNSPNDVVVASDGSVYFTDPPYGIEASVQQQPVAGVYRLLPGAPEPELIANNFERPNGLAFSPDESTLYVDDSSLARRHVKAFEVDGEGRLTIERLFVDMDVEAEGVPDGMKIDESGNMFCTGPGGLWVLSASGVHLGTVFLPELPANCAWGDDDFRSLYITARTGVYRLRTRTKGVGIHID